MLNMQEGSLSLAEGRLSATHFVAFDVETTGLSPVACRLVELSGVKFRLGDQSVAEFSSLINPQCEIPPEATRVHGITQDMVEDSPTVHQVLPAFLEFIGDNNTVLVAHNASFDIGFLQVAMARLRIPYPACSVVDTLPLSRCLLPESPNHQLRTLVETLQLAVGDYHRALADSHHVRHVLSKLIHANPDLVSLDNLMELGCILRMDDDGSGYFRPDENISQYIELIRGAIDQGHSVKFIYSGYSRRSRVVSPISVIQNRGNYYLTAYCKKVAAERTFRVDKIVSIQSVPA